MKNMVYKQKLEARCKVLQQVTEFADCISGSDEIIGIATNSI
jgi:hypothetical protein